MQSLSLILSKQNSRTILVDSLIFAAIYLTPAFSHMLNLPLYIIEPMRLMLFVAVLYSSKSNGLLIALTLPFFSLLTSGHPPLFKAILISGELMFNVILYFYFSGKIKNYFIPILLSITLAKIFYYILKFGFISSGLIYGDLVTIPLFAQILVAAGTTAIFGGLLYLDSRKK